VWRGALGMVSAVSSRAIAGLFPGQGSQTSDLRERVQSAVPELLARCVELVGEDPFVRVADSTRFAQPAIFCASIAGWNELRARVRPLAYAGHSLGELSALVAADALDPLDGLELAVLRGTLMAASGDGGEGMLAVLAAEDDYPGRLASGHEIVIANDNAPGQVVLAGATENLRAASAQAREDGVRAIMLDVAGAFHSPSMAAAVQPFREALEQIEFREPTVPVISGATSLPFADVRADLAAAIVSPVRWREVMGTLASLGADTFIDFGPGQVLAKLVRRNLPDGEVLKAEALRDPLPVGSGDA
jgi:[acyl-carrier-protein] S-malonyltransferase